MSSNKLTRRTHKNKYRHLASPSIEQETEPDRISEIKTLVHFSYGSVWLQDEEYPPSYKSFCIVVNDETGWTSLVPKEDSTAEDVMLELGLAQPLKDSWLIVLPVVRGKAQVFVLHSRPSDKGHLMVRSAGVNTLPFSYGNILLEFKHGDADKLCVDAELASGKEYFLVHRVGFTLGDNRVGFTLGNMY